MNKKFIGVLIGFGFVLLACKQYDSFSFETTKDLGQNSYAKKATDTGGEKEGLSYYLPKSSASQIVIHNYYTLSYNERAEQAEWVAYELKKEYVRNSNFKRPFFIEDPKVITQSADWRNYKNSGYDKGHLCPAADMEFNLEAFYDTFFTSNISPQNHEFNSGIWNRLEQKFRYWAVKHDGLVIVTGGVLKGDLETIGDEGVFVPRYFYKIALNRSNGNYKMIAFLVPNEKSSKPIFDFVVSVDKIESLTGIDFFPKLDDKVENTLEKSTDISVWLSK